jgi:hypothetical protein
VIARARLVCSARLHQTPLNEDLIRIAKDCRVAIFAAVSFYLAAKMAALQFELI